MNSSCALPPLAQYHLRSSLFTHEEKCLVRYELKLATLMGVTFEHVFI